MKKNVLLTTIAFSLILMINSFIYAETATKADAMDSIKKANGILTAKKDAGLADIENLNKDLLAQKGIYVYVMTLNDGILVVHPKLKGKNITNLTDKNGKKFIQDQQKIVKDGKSGWVDYLWPNPITTQIEHKNTYVEKASVQIKGNDGKIQDVMLACGISFDAK